MRRVLFLIAVSVLVSLAATSIAFLLARTDRLPGGAQRTDEVTE